MNPLPIAFAFCLALVGHAAAECPPAPDISDEQDRLIDLARAANSPAEGQAASAGMWALWTRAPDARAQALLDEGMQRREATDLRGALVAFDALVQYCPEYAEGYNQRAFANFLRGDLEAALPDLDRAIALRPRHVAAISGRGLTLIRLGRIREGQDAIRTALELNPWLSERQFLSLDPNSGIVDL